MMTKTDYRLLFWLIYLSVWLSSSKVLAGQQEVTETLSENIETTATSNDLDNSILQADVGSNSDRQKDEHHQPVQYKETISEADNKTVPEEQVDSNDLAPSGEGQSHWQPKLKQQNHHQADRQEPNRELLSRRLDLLEFELKKTILLLHHQMRISSDFSTGPNNRQPPTNFQEGPKNNQPDDPQPHSNSDQTNRIAKSQPPLEALADLSSRLELMEKFITVTTKKLYETEQRVKQLERCDCHMKCKWMQPADGFATSPNQQEAEKPSVKLDGQVWRHNCDVCSCHRGHVKCRHVSCPKVNCPEPSYVSGRCCPVCHENCSFSGQTVKHGHKLVINSKQNTCKECLCSNGRLKCHRVEQLELDYSLGNNVSLPASPTTTSTATSTQSIDDYRQRRVQRSTPIDLGLNFSIGSPKSLGSSSSLSLASDKIDEHDGRWTKVLADSSGPQLVCPQIDCKLEDQIKLKNDCCTYCRGFDFCSIHGRAHCHPNAACLLATNGSSLTNQTEVDGKQLTLSSMFDCRCRTGFSGSGRFCRDIDECADRKLNDCDPRTSYCVNLPGSYQCKCRPGYREAPASSGPSPESNTVKEQLSKNSERLSKICRDINECSYGELNKCHQQARCINLNGSYKCRCKMGYLGNGFECHQWFSPRPGVAAYLHRHSSSAAPSSTNNHSQQRTDFTSSEAINVPLDSLIDHDDGRSDMDRDQLDSSEYNYGDDEATNDGDAENKIRNSSPADLANSRWEPLKFAEQANVFQQTDGLVSANQQALLAHQPDEDNPRLANPLNGYHTTTTTTTITTTTEPYVSSLNTRTMFFQPPPKFRRPQNATSKNLTAVSSTDSTTTNDSKKLIDMTNYQPQTIIQNESPAKQTSSPLTDSSSNSSAQRKLTSNQTPQLKRGSIIASATTSPSRGLYPNQYHHATQLQNRNLFHQQHKALRVSSSSASAVRQFPSIKLDKVRSLANRSSFGFVFGFNLFNLVFTLIASISQILFIKPKLIVY